jgi:hypothetical protein
MAQARGGKGREMNEQVPAQPAGREVVGSYRNHEDARRAVEFLGERDFPVEQLTILGEGVRTQEQVVGRVGAGSAGAAGAANGIFVAMLFFLLFWAFDAVDPVSGWGWVLLYAVLWGAVIGALIGLLFHALSGGSRVASVGGVVADRYDIMAPTDVAGRARELLAGFSSSG